MNGELSYGRKVFLRYTGRIPLLYNNWIFSLLLQRNFNIGGFFMSKNHSSRFTPQNLAILAILIATEIVLSRFLSISLWNIKIGFAFLPVAYAAYRYGALEAMVVAGLSDFIGAMLFPIGTYFPGFTLTAVLTGAVEGLLLYKHCSFKRIITSVVCTQLLGSLLLNSLWISILYSSAFLPLLAVRSAQVVLMILVKTATLQVFFNALPAIAKPKRI